MDFGVISAVVGLAALASDTVTQIVRNEQEREDIAAAANVKSQELQAKAQSETKERKNLLKQQMASRIAKFASSGVSVDEGSSAKALLGGMVDDAEDDLTNIRNSYRLGIDSLNNSLASSQTRNLLNNVDTISNTAKQLLT